jgi:hypothetical protein
MSFTIDIDGAVAPVVPVGPKQTLTAHMADCQIKESFCVSA